MQIADQWRHTSDKADGGEADDGEADDGCQKIALTNCCVNALVLLQTITVIAMPSRGVTLGLEIAF